MDLVFDTIGGDTQKKLWGSLKRAARWYVNRKGPTKGGGTL